MSALTFGNYVGDVRASAGRQPAAAAAVARCRPGPVAYPLHPVQLSHAGCDDCAGGRPAAMSSVPITRVQQQVPCSALHNGVTAAAFASDRPTSSPSVRSSSPSVSTACTHEKRFHLTCCTYIHCSFICSYFALACFFLRINFDLLPLDVISPEVIAPYVWRDGAVVASSTADRSTFI